ncbi:MAG: acetyl-CoA carboxylase biotin carboxyl carrier protein subunit [Deltaproteobacteria bacterium]|nr:acetyl-CoA carboxylase biotin carboxyl carrier protein subunit [Deltaproteobacteria bacterium]
MKYFVTIDEREHCVEVAARPNGELLVTLDGHSFDNDVVVLDDGSLSIRIDGRVLDLTVEGSPPDVGVIASGHRAYVRVESDRQRAAAAARKHGGGGHEKAIVAPMPGRVVKVLVQPGDEVAAGQGVVVVEAMKMENELRAKGPGKVAEICVKPGDAIESGARLVTFG